MDWINIKEELPITYQEGRWDGKKSDWVVVRDGRGEVFTAELYSGILDGFEFNDFYDNYDNEIGDISHWLKLPEFI